MLIKELNDTFMELEYPLSTFNRSNQDTSLVHRPAVFPGQWVQSGDLLADCSTSVGGEISLGQNILIAYMPWEGYNFEDAILVSERLVYDDLYTSVHIEKYELDMLNLNIDMEEITRTIPNVDAKEIENLDEFGVIKLGSWVKEGDILIGKVKSIERDLNSNFKQLMDLIIDKPSIPGSDTSLRASKGVHAKVIEIKFFKDDSFIEEEMPIEVDSKLLLSDNPGSKVDSLVLTGKIKLKNKSKLDINTKKAVLSLASLKGTGAKPFLASASASASASLKPLRDSIYESLIKDEAKEVRSEERERSDKNTPLFAYVNETQNTHPYPSKPSQKPKSKTPSLKRSLLSRSDNRDDLNFNTRNLVLSSRSTLSRGNQRIAFKSRPSLCSLSSSLLLKLKTRFFRGLIRSF